MDSTQAQTQIRSRDAASSQTVDDAAVHAHRWRYADLERVAAGCLHELFESQVDLRPDAIATIYEGQTQSYAELEARANQLARYLRQHGAGPGRFVVLYFERSLSPIVAILACLKAGAAYVPIDPAYPGDRIRHILGEAQPVLFLTERSLAARAAEFEPEGLTVVDSLAPELESLPSHRLSRRESGVAPEDLCYVIYTSGTTGRPKGVMAEHRHAFRFVLSFNEVCGTTVEDRVYQGFSLGFDGSVEEIWMAFSNGSALVVGSPQTPRFGDELGQFLADQGVSYLSTVPTLLSTISQAPPSLRLLVVSGEICPPELVNRWARPGLRMLNVYGPTEATVNTTAFECVAGQPVTIGKPLLGYDLYILDEQQRQVAAGEKGELYVGGETLARGYFERPELTAERFVTLSGIASPGPARLYRSGDLVRWNASGELEFFGRIDSQVKIRGYRVELAEIESLLLENPAIRSASVKLTDRDGLQELAAYVLLKEPSQPLDRGQLLAQLEARLPAYMIPGHLDVLAELPTLASGKVDRARLPAPVMPLVRVAAQLVGPEGELEIAIAAVWAKLFGLPAVSVEDDFFHDLGGHSLVAAQMVTRLRHDITKPVTVRDAYHHPTVRRLAGHLAALPVAAAERRPGHESVAPPSSRAVFARQPGWVRGATATLQLLSTYLLYALVSIPAAIFFLLGRGWLLGELPLSSLLWGTVALSFATWPVLLVISIAAKWLIIGRYRAGSYPLWGFYYFRFWLANRFAGLSGAGALAGTPLLPLYFRLMGARVGRGCTLGTAACAAWDLVAIGDDTSLGADSQLLGYRVESGMLHLGRVDIGSRCFVGIHSALGLDSRLGDDSALDDQSLLADRQTLGPGESGRGSPAQRAEVVLAPPPVGNERRRQPLRYGLAHLLILELSSLVFLIPGLPLFALLYVVSERHPQRFSDVSGLVTGWLVGSVPVGVVTSCLFLAALKRLVLHRVRPGVYPIESLFYLRKWFSDGLMRASRSMLLPLYTTLYLPPWLRLMGAKIGRRAELSTVWNFAPELIEVGEESFFADGSIIGGKRCHLGGFELGMNHIGRRSFVGNSAVLPVGGGLGDRCLLGVQSIPPAGMVRTPDGTEWLGSPAFALPNRPKVGNFGDAVTFHPTTKLYLQRAVIDLLRILIPGYIGLSAAVLGTVALNWLLGRLGVLAMFAAAPVVGLLLGLYAIALVALLKKLVMGTFAPVIKPLWSMYVWLNEMVNGAYESVMAPAIAPFLGTPFVAPLLRLVGCKIGRHTFIETTLFSEFDLVEIGDYAALNAGAVIQNHLFEDRVMKSSYLKIGDECAVGNMAVVLYDSEMQRGSTLGPLSLLMKGETLAPHGRWHGIPSVPAEPPPERSAAPKLSAPPAGERFPLGESEAAQVAA